MYKDLFLHASFKKSCFFCVREAIQFEWIQNIRAWMPWTKTFCIHWISAQCNNSETCLVGRRKMREENEGGYKCRTIGVIRAFATCSCKVGSDSLNFCIALRVLLYVGWMVQQTGRLQQKRRIKSIPNDPWGDTLKTTFGGFLFKRRSKCLCRFLFTLVWRC